VKYPATGGTQSLDKKCARLGTPHRQQSSSAVVVIVSPLPSSSSSVVAVAARFATLRDRNLTDIHSASEKKNVGGGGASPPPPRVKKKSRQLPQKNKKSAKCLQQGTGAPARGTTSTTDAKEQPHHKQSRGPAKGWGRKHIS